MSDSNGNTQETDREGAEAGPGATPEEPAESPEATGAEATASEPTPEDRLEQLSAEREKLRDQVLRVSADFDNFRKRTRRDVEDAERRGREEALRELLPIIDNLERAAHASEGSTDVQAIGEGVKMVLRQFEDTAARIGLERVQAVGQRFDPTVHDAVQQQETDEHAPGTVVAEVVPGYKLGERLLRPAMVVVARPPAPEGSPKDGDAQESAGDPS